MTLEEIRKALKDRRLSIISRATGLHSNTLAKIRDGVTLDPGHNTVLLLGDYLKGEERGGK